MSAAFDFLLDFQPGEWLNLSLRGFFVYLFVLWAALVVWVARDVVGRTKNLALQTVAILLTVVLNLFGLLIYLIIRPQKTLLERYYEDLEQKALTEHDELCPACERPLPLEFRFCPGCGAEVRRPCLKCKKLMSKGWQSCAYCGNKKGTGKKG
jgi:RNA polymerase subunit RPABC4/transcription elongation factor Spt4